MTTTATSTTWPQVPSWQEAELAQLSAGGQLSGVTPRAIAAIDQAESSGTGGGINATGYGGWFGLGAGHQYPGGTPTAALLSSTTPQAFATQATISASAFNSYLAGAGGNYVSAEEVYQSGNAAGPTEGSKIMASYGPWPTTPATSASGTGTASTTAATGTPATTTGFFTLGIPGAITSAEKNFVQFAIKGLLVGAGLILVIVGFAHIASPATKQNHPEIGKVAGAVSDAGLVAA